MKKQLGISMALSLGLLVSNVAMANDAVLGALLGGGAGVLVGRSIGGRNGALVGGALGAAAGAAIGSEQQYRPRTEQRVDYYSPPPVYYSQQPYYPPQPVYYSQPMRRIQPPVYYIDRGYYRSESRHHHRDWSDRR